jgi:hypothetical protein
MIEFITDILKPETELEKTIIADPEFQEGAMQGEPRPGHPEGKIVYHIREVLDNVEKYRALCMNSERRKLRIISFIHDTFKHKVDYSKPRVGENHHAMIARRFAEKYIEDTLVLDIIELHDEAYNAWGMGNRKDNWKGAEERIARLLARIDTHERNSRFMYSTFYKCDNETGDKSQDNLEWFSHFI